MKLLKSVIILIGVVAGSDVVNQINSGTDKRDFKVSNLEPKILVLDESKAIVAIVKHVTNRFIGYIDVGDQMSW